MDRVANKKLVTGILISPVAAGAKLVPGTMAAINSNGYAVTASKAEGLKVAGCVETLADNTSGADGDITVTVDRGAYVWNGDNTITKTSVLSVCYVKDATTVTLTPTGSSPAGIITAVDDDGVTVDMTQATVITQVASMDATADATATTAGKVKAAANQAASTATDAAGVITDFNALLTKLKAAGVMVADAAE